MSLKKWDNVDWRLVEKRVFRYQRRIYEASKRGDNRIVKGLQKKIISSVDSKLLVVKQVTIERRKKYSRDGLYVTSEDKLRLASKLRINSRLSLQQKSKVASTQITSESLLILEQLEEETKQALCLLALEPEWEGRILQHCYGLRPGRWKQDAIEAIYSYSIKTISFQRFHTFFVKVKNKKSLRDMDIKKLLDKLETLPIIRNQLYFWLSLERIQKHQIENEVNNIKFDNKEKYSVFNFIFNVALEGLIEKVRNEIDPTKLQLKTFSIFRNSLCVIRYSDEILFLHENAELVKKVDEVVDKLLQKSCTLTISKKVISSSNKGFDFLKYQFLMIVKNGINKLKISPTREAQVQILSDIRESIKKNKAASSYKLILLLTPKILAWGNYYRYCECTNIFRKISHYILQKLRSWAFRRDKRNGRENVKERYFPSNREYTFEGKHYRDNWILNGYSRRENGVIDKIWLPNLSWVQRKRWIGVIKSKSVYDRDHHYWNFRTSYYKVNYN
jgi:RNA-directed DNA polymerase